jgi:serine/threonine protein kinase
VLSPGEIDGYSEFTRIGSGGFSTVYRARQERFNRLVAVKVLTTTLVDDQAQRRFLRECRIAGLVSNHPNIVTVLDAGFTGDGQPFIVFEYMSGGSLATRLTERGPFHPGEVLAIGGKLCSALDRVHQEGVLHRDVKPLNVLVSAFGEPCLTDFGISAISTGLGATSMTSSLTPLFTAPEVLDGENSTVAADIYSLAATLYALLVGRAPFQPTGNESVRKTLSRIFEEPVPPIERDDVPEALQACLERALAKRPEDRHATISEFGQELQRIQLAMPAKADSDALADAQRPAAAPSKESAVKDLAIDLAGTDDPTLQRTVVISSIQELTNDEAEASTVRRGLPVIDRAAEQATVRLAPATPGPDSPLNPAVTSFAEDKQKLVREAAAHHEVIGRFAEKLLVGKQLWTEKQQVLRLLQLTRQAGDRKVAAACQQALHDGVLDVAHVKRCMTGHQRA